MLWNREFLARILSATNYCTETLALFYDELAAVLSNQNCSSHNAGIDKHFLTWLCDLITLYFQQNFVLECDTPGTNVYVIQLIKFGINTQKFPKTISGME